MSAGMGTHMRTLVPVAVVERVADSRKRQPEFDDNRQLRKVLILKNTTLYHVSTKGVAKKDLYSYG